MSSASYLSFGRIQNADSSAFVPPFLWVSILSAVHALPHFHSLFARCIVNTRYARQDQELCAASVALMMHSKQRRGDELITVAPCSKRQSCARMPSKERSDPNVMNI